jgi:hypothetical protein
MARVLVALAALPLILFAAAASGDEAPPVGAIAAAVAPVALYPDALLTPLLMAATYPEEVAEADGWLGEGGNAALRGDELVAAIQPRPWDPSVKALVPFPVVLDMMAARPAWTAQLGRLFIAVPGAVMAEIQKLRRQALATGKLGTSPQLVATEMGGVIVIAPADPAMAYVPVYAASVYGAWAYSDFPPAVLEPPKGFEAASGGGMGFTVGFSVLTPLWGWAHPAWASGTVEIDTAAFNRINRYGPHAANGTWHHEAHGTGYFHITRDQVTPEPAKSKKHAHAAKGKTKHAAHAAKGKAKHAKAKGRGNRKSARGKSPAHRGKVHVADEGRGHHRR